MKTSSTFMIQVQKSSDSSYSFVSLLKVAIYFPENRFLVINHQAQPPNIKRDNYVIRDNENNVCSRLVELPRKIEDIYSPQTMNFGTARAPNPFLNVFK